GRARRRSPRTAATTTRCPRRAVACGSWRAPEHEAGIVAAEAEGIAQRHVHASRFVLPRELRPAGGIGRGGAEVAGYEIVLDRLQRDRGLDDARRAQRVAGEALGRTR